MTPDPQPERPADPPAAWHGRRGEILVAIQFALLLAFVLIPPWSPWATTPLLDATWMLRASLLALLWASALALGVLGFLSIRRYLTPLPYPVDHNRLVTGGVYGLVRHPLYGSQLLAALGWICWTLSLPHLGLLVLGLLFFDYKAGKEEAWLTERHPEYLDYKRQARKLIPWIY